MLPAPCASHTQKLLHGPGVTRYSAFSSLKTLSHSPLNALPPTPSFIFISLRLSLRKEPLYLFLICSLVPPLLELSSLRAEKCMFCLLCHLLGLTQNWQLVGAHLINICHTGIVNYYETFSSSLSPKTKRPHPSCLLFPLKVKKKNFFVNIEFTEN